MEPVSQAATNLPLWLQYAGTLGGFFVSVLTVLAVIFKLFSRPSLEVMLTKEFFFRFSELGECVFPNAILIARTGMVEVRDTYFKLKRVEGSEKTYSLDVLRIGKKVQSSQASGNTAENLFFTTSPLDYLIPTDLRRPLYLAVVSEHAEAIRGILNDYKNNVHMYRNELPPYQVIQAEPEKYFQEIIAEVERLKGLGLERIMEKIQIEDGVYHLEIHVKYLPVDIFRKVSKLRNAVSSIEFEVEGIRDMYRFGIDEMLREIAYGIIFPERQSSYSYPEYQPLKVNEK